MGRGSDESAPDAFPARGRWLMVARLVTLDRDLRGEPFARSGVRSIVRGRRPEWPPVRRVSAYENHAPGGPAGQWPVCPVSPGPKVGGIRAPLAGPTYPVADVLQRRQSAGEPGLTGG